MEKEEQAACNGGDNNHEADMADTLDDEAAAKEKLTGGGGDSKVKFTPVNLDGYDSKNGDAKVDLHVGQTTIGMGKEELLKYANEPYWIRLRMALFVLFWLVWLAMLVGSVVIIILAPRCPPAPKVEWYQKAAMYQVDVKAFKDSDGNGVGDIKGLISKISYFKEQNIDALMLSSFYKSASNGIVDHKDIDSSVGTMEDFSELVIQLKEKDIRLVIDFVPNHSSDEHEWFTKSAAGQEPYKDFYVWADGSEGGGPPNNWLNTDGESAWKWNNERNQYYLHTFGEHMPDLNLRNELVKQELKEIINFWMSKGIDGFKVVAASHLVEDKDLRDEPISTQTGTDKRDYKTVDHRYTVDQPENSGLFAEWRELLKNFTDSTGIPKILMPQLSGFLNASILYYGNDTEPLTDLPYNIHFTELNEQSKGTELKDHLDSLMNNIPSHGWPTLLVGSDSVPRLASRVGEDLVDAIHMVAVFSKGTPITYYADELGITDSESATKSKTRLTQTVMLWNNETNSGFTNGSTSLHVPSNYGNINVEAQRQNKQSHLNIFSRLLALRGQPALNFGLQEYPLVTDDIFSLMRVRKGSPGYLVVLNLGRNTTVVDFTGKSTYLPEMARVEIRSSNVISGPLSEGDHPKIQLKEVPLEPKQSVVFSFVPIFQG